MKLAFVTGGSRGLGNAIVEQLTEQEWHVHEFSRTGASPHSTTVDLSNPQKAIEIVEKLFTSYEARELDEILLISNAGVLTPIEYVAKLKTEEILNNLSVNILSAVGIMQVFVKKFRNTPVRKTILSVSSGAAQRGYEGWSLYCCGKAAMENFLRSLHKEEQNLEAPFRIINFNPGVIDTAMQSEIRSVSPEAFPQKERFVNYKRAGLLTPPERVAHKAIEIINNSDSLTNLNYSADER